MEQLLTIRDVAEILKISIPTINALRRSGEFPAPKQVGQSRTNRWTRESIDQWVQSR